RIEFLEKIKGFAEAHISRNPVLYLFPSSCGKLYKAELIENIHFNNKIKYAEDLLFSTEVFFQSKKTLVMEDFVYYYRGRGDTVNTSITQEKTIQNLLDLQISVQSIEGIVKENQFSLTNETTFKNTIQFYRMLEASQHVASVLQYPEDE